MVGLVLKNEPFWGCDGGTMPNNAKTLFLRPDGSAKLLSWSALNILGPCAGQCELCDVTANYSTRMEETLS